MTKTLATLFGIVYVLMGIAGLFDTALIGTNGFFAADAAYSIAFMVIGAVLLFAALFRQDSARGITLTMGALLALIGLSGFLIAPERGEMLGMFVNTADHWFNLVVGLILAGVAYADRSERSAASVYRQYTRHAMQ